MSSQQLLKLGLFPLEDEHTPDTADIEEANVQFSENNAAQLVQGGVYHALQGVHRILYISSEPSYFRDTCTNTDRSHRQHIHRSE